MQQPQIWANPKAFEPITDAPGLPRALLIGDSISIGYTLMVRELLKGKANVHRIPENGGPTSNGVEKIDAWLGEGKWDVIHFNFGLHDIRRMDGGQWQVSRSGYENNLTRLVRRMKKTGAKLIFATTTPVPQGKLSPPRIPGDEVTFNAIALRVMNAEGVGVNDLHAYAAPHLSEWQVPANVHFHEAGCRELAKKVAAAIVAALPG
jgi:lysophospholipase L1-like esterase